VAAWPLVAFVLWDAWPQSRLLSAKKPFLRLSFALTAAIIIVVAVQLILNQSLGLIAKRADPWQATSNFDLAAISIVKNTLLFSKEAGVARKGVRPKDLLRVYSPTDHLQLYYGCINDGGQRCRHALRRAHSPKQLAALKRDWFKAILKHPNEYFQHRLRVYAPLIGITGQHSVTTYFQDSIDENPFGLKMPRNRWRDAYSSRLREWSRSPLYAVWIYLAFALILFGSGLGLWASGRSPIVAALAGSGLAYHATYFFFTGSPDFRYSVWTILVTLLAACSLLFEREEPAESEHIETRIPPMNH